MKTAILVLSALFTSAALAGPAFCKKSPVSLRCRPGAHIVKRGGCYVCSQQGGKRKN